MKKTRLVLVAAITAIAPIHLMAHPGHGETEGFSIIHYFSEPLHLTVAVLVAIASIVLYTRLRGNTRNKKA